MDDDILKWITFTATSKSKAIMYSKQKGSVKHNLKKFLLSEIEKIEGYEGNSDVLKSHLSFHREKLKILEKGEIEGFKLRIKFLPSFEKDEPNIEFLSKVEDRKKAQETITQLSEKPNGQILTNRKDIMRISTNFYKDLYTPSKVNALKQERLLKISKIN